MVQFLDCSEGLAECVGLAVYEGVSGDDPFRPAEARSSAPGGIFTGPVCFLALSLIIRAVLHPKLGVR